LSLPAAFEALNVQLVGVSVDSVYSHIAWMRDIEAFAGVTVTFPVVADLDQKVSQLYGMIHQASSNTSAVRAVFAIDPKQKVRVILYYPMQMGRNVDELLRVFQALKRNDCTCGLPDLNVAGSVLGKTNLVRRDCPEKQFGGMSPQEI
jgi:peroxiredoxin 2/4